MPVTREGGPADQDAHLEWVRPIRHGRQGGAKVYIDAWTLREALEAAGIDESTPIEDLEVMRKTMPHGNRNRAQVLLVFRRARCEHGLRAEDCIEHRGRYL